MTTPNPSSFGETLEALAAHEVGAPDPNWIAQIANTFFAALPGETPEASHMQTPIAPNVPNTSELALPPATGTGRTGPVSQLNLPVNFLPEFTKV